jgi:hypothetical protein
MDSVLNTLSEEELKKRKKDLQIQVKKINEILKNINTNEIPIKKKIILKNKY